MLPTINGKSFLECDENDLQEIIDNPAYRENEYLDYKRSFSILDYPKSEKQKREDAIAEFRSDVCSFANAEGGYLIYGVGESGDSFPTCITGVSLKESTDKFELSVKNWLNTIQPRIPNHKINFVLLNDGRYVIIIYIYHDFFAPYIHLEDKKDYRIYKRVGNSKTTIAYSELKNMFIQSLNLEKEIENFRRERIEYCRTLPRVGARFLLFQIIPETFINSDYNEKMILKLNENVRFSEIFKSFGNDYFVQSIVEGLRYKQHESRAEFRIYNNKIAELVYPLKDEIAYTQSAGKRLRIDSLWDKISDSINEYFTIMKPMKLSNRCIICLSIIGCKGIVTHYDFCYPNPFEIDRDELLFNAFVFEDIYNDELKEMDIKRLKLDYYFSLGVMGTETTNKLIKEVYGK